MSSISTELQIKMKDGNGDPWNIAFRYADDEADAADVKALADGIITNKSIWEKQPATKVSAALVTTEVIDVDISD